MLRNNDLDLRFDLDGEWDFTLGDGPRQSIRVPGAWEGSTGDFLTDGPGVYTREVDLGPAWQDRRIWLEVDAASFAAEVFVNDAPAGTHRGAWSAFQIELTDLWRPGRNSVRIEIWKPGRSHPVRETLAGFLPDVCTTFGGLWQSVRLRGAEPKTPGFTDLLWTVAPDGSVNVAGALDLSRPEPMTVALTLGRRRITNDLAPNQTRFTLALPKALRKRYRPEAPHRADVRLEAWASDGRVLARTSRRLGRRWFATQADTLLLDGNPVHLRGVLDWGWNPRTVSPRLDDVAGQFARARALGFNLFKCCLYVPDEAFLDAADAAGMWIWLEMPLWLPSMTPALQALARDEYRAIFERLHHHPCLAVITLGCELNRATSAPFLRELEVLARRFFPGALIGDNSGSAEAYGGVRTDLGDFVDYHFYADPHFFGPLVQHFDRGYRTPKPWLYGEFCDADTLRDFRPVQDAWWLTTPTPLDRDDFLAQRDHGARFEAAGIADGGADLTAIARRQATAVRKHIIERVRRRDATGGYVITGWRDTPITTSGLVDDTLQHKFAPDEWRAFNADRVLCLDRDRRRLWAGGDRPSPREPYVFWSRETTELHLCLANGCGPTQVGRIIWELLDSSGYPVSGGDQPAAAIPAGCTREIAVVDLALPSLAVPTAFRLRATWSAGDAEALINTWRLLVVPKPALPPVVALAGLETQRPNLQALWPATVWAPLAEAPASAPVLADRVTDAALAAVRRGRSGVVWLTEPDYRLTRQVPFWREAIHTVDFARFGLPAHDHLDLTAHGVAADQALLPDAARALEAQIGGPATRATPWRRFDARSLVWHDYWQDLVIESGRCAITTLRLAGGLGEQPAQLTANPLGVWLLARGLAPPDQTP